MRSCSLGLRWLNGTRARFGLLPGRRPGSRKGRLPNKYQLGPLIYRGYSNVRRCLEFIVRKSPIQFRPDEAVARAPGEGRDVFE